MKLYKLSFESKEAFKTVLETLAIVTEESVHYPFAFVEVGHVPIPATYDEEGVELTEATFHLDYAVDVLSEVVIPEFEPFKLITAPSRYYHGFAGVNIKPE